MVVVVKFMRQIISHCYFVYSSYGDKARATQKRCGKRAQQRSILEPSQASKMELFCENS